MKFKITEKDKLPFVREKNYDKPQNVFCWLIWKSFFFWIIFVDLFWVFIILKWIMGFWIEVVDFLWIMAGGSDKKWTWNFLWKACVTKYFKIHSIFYLKLTFFLQFLTFPTKTTKPTFNEAVKVISQQIESSTRHLKSNQSSKKTQLNIADSKITKKTFPI